MDKEDVVHVYSGILLSHEKEQDIVLCNNMEEPKGCHSQRNKSDREREVRCDIIHTWDLKTDTDELIYNTETDLQT